MQTYLINCSIHTCEITHKLKKLFTSYYFIFWVAWLACAWSACLSSLWPWFDSQLKPYMSIGALIHQGFFFRALWFPPSGKIKHFWSQAVLRGHILVDVAGCQRCPRKPGAHTRCSRILHSSASQLRVRIISLPNYYYFQSLKGW